MDSVRVSGEAPGTQIEVRSLFYNLPARRKFLRSENTEASHVQHQLSLQAIGHPNIGFVSLRDQTMLFQAPPAKTLGDRIRDLRGSELFEQLLEIERLEPAQRDHCFRFHRQSRSKPVHESGADPFCEWSTRGKHYDSTRIAGGLSHRADEGSVPGDLSVPGNGSGSGRCERTSGKARSSLSASRISKVRKQRRRRLIRKTLEADRRRWTHSFDKPRETAKAPVHLSGIDPTPPLIPPAEQFALRRDWADFHSDPVNTEPRPVDLQVPVEPCQPVPGIPLPPARLESRSEFRILGILGKLYILMENSEGLVLVDQHAAHERILFEKLRRQMETEGVPTQRLLIPLTVGVTPKDYDWISTNAQTLEKMGFALEPFGNSTLKIDGIPQFFRTDDPSVTIRQLVDELRSMTTTTSRMRMGEDVIARTVCHHAIKANDELHRPEVERLLEDLMACELPYCCPHGRPTMIQIGYGELEKKFGRKV